MMAAPTGALQLFYSYAHEDEQLRKKLEKHLSLLKQQGLIVDWHDRDISAGREWRSEIDAHLNTADIILLLISPDFIASEYCYSNEMMRAVERHEAGEARVIPILLRPTDWESTPFHKLQALPEDARPITKWRPRDDAFLNVAQGIRKAVEELRASSSFPPSFHATGQMQSLRQFWNVPYHRNRFFTGREDLLTQLHERFTTTKTTALTQAQAISGLGGIGKTQIAVEYAHRYRNEYSTVLWVNAVTSESLCSDFVQLASLLHLPEKDAQDQNITIEAVKGWLVQQRDWLLILDNADDLAMVHDFLPSGERGHILLTTRSHVTGKVASRIEVEKMDQEEGTLLLLRRAGMLASEALLDTVRDVDRAEAQAIVAAVDGLPLALDQAGAYIEETGCGLSEYLALYQTRHKDLLGRPSTFSADYPKTVATTWSLSFQQVERANRAASDVLRLCAFLAPDAIPEEILTDGAAELGKVLGSVAANTLRLNEAMGVVQRYSLLRRHSEMKTLSMHRLVQVVLKDTMTQKTQRQWAQRAVRAVNHVFPQVEVATWSHCLRLLPQALICAVLIDHHGLAFPAAARLLHQAGHYLQDHQALYGQAELLYQRALSIYEQVEGPQHPDTASTLYALARLYHVRGRYTHAEPLYQRALSIREQALGTDHPDTAETLGDLATLYLMQGQYEQAEPLYQRALSIRERALGTDHPDTAETLYDLARLYQAQGRYEQAEPLYQRALSICEQVEGPQHPSTAATLQALATLYQNQGRYEQAEPLYQRALSICEQVLGPEHPSTATTLRNLATLYQSQGRYEQAEPLYQRALSICEQVLGPVHPSTAATLQALATLYQNLGRYEQAEPLYQRALNVREQVLGLAHSDTASTLESYASLLRKMNREREAVTLEAHIKIRRAASSSETQVDK